MHKEFFCIFDYCQNLEFFGENPEGYEAPLQESVKQKIFKRRLSIVGHLQRRTESGESLDGLRGELLDQMHAVVCSFNVDNFIVRPQRRHVEEFSIRERWDDLSENDVDTISLALSGLPSPDDDDEDARRFDLLVLNLQLAILESAPAQDQYRKGIIELATALEEKKAIPSVAAQLSLILEVQTDEYWEHVTLPMLEKLRRDLRELIKFCDRQGAREIVYTDFEDEVGEEGEAHELLGIDENLRNYRKKVERFIRANKNHITIKRLRNNEPITHKDLEAFEAMLFSESSPTTKEQFAETYGNERPLGRLIRSIIGLDRRAAKEAFGEFRAKAPLSADQLRFLDSVIEHLAKNGVMDPKALFDTPFTDFHHEGVSGVMADRAPEVVEIIREINSNAEAA
ncbi:MAG: type I restriction-modification enzyme R subunit C-terminal domain-containing protein [Gammaproteobacteria bacterium]